MPTIDPAAPPAPQRAVAQVWVDVWKQVDRDTRKWAKRIVDGDDPWTVGETARLRALTQGILQLRALQPNRALYAARVTERLREGARASFGIVVDALPAHVLGSARDAAQMVGSLNLLNRDALLNVVQGNVGQLSVDYLAMTEAAQARMVADLATSVITGEGPRELRERMLRSIEPSFGTAHSRSMRIARTTLARAYDQSRADVYQRAAAAGVLHGWRWVAHGKDPCDVCATLDGLIFEPGGDPDRHPNCVCSNVPVLMDEPAAAVPFGERWQPRAGTSMRNVYRHTSESGFTSWRAVPGRGLTHGGSTSLAGSRDTPS